MLVNLFYICGKTIKEKQYARTYKLPEKVWLLF